MRNNVVSSMFALKNHAKQRKPPTLRPGPAVPPRLEIAHPTVIQEQTASAEQPSGAHPDTAEDQTICADAQNLGGMRKIQASFPSTGTTLTNRM